MHEVRETVLGDGEGRGRKDGGDRGEGVKVDGDVALSVGVVPWGVGYVVECVGVVECVSQVSCGSEFSVR